MDLGIEESEARVREFWGSGDLFGKGKTKERAAKWAGPGATAVLLLLHGWVRPTRPHESGVRGMFGLAV